MQQRRQEFAALGQALQSGDLQSAQKAFAALNPSAASSTQAAQSSSKFSGLAQALQSGDLAGAQKAFAAISSHGHHRQQAPTPPVLSSTSTVGSNVNVLA
jgi:hypothetical protein